MTLPLKPRLGGFLCPFGCGWFIREFLMGHGPYGSPKIGPTIGAPQADIFYHYKMTLRNEAALDKATSVEEKRARREQRPEELSEFQAHYPPGPPRRYYQLTLAGHGASDIAWANPQYTLYG